MYNNHFFPYYVIWFREKLNVFTIINAVFGLNKLKFSSFNKLKYLIERFLTKSAFITIISLIFDVKSRKKNWKDRFLVKT